eukprot:912927-Pyramimonas_sp.AAC.3
MFGAPSGRSCVRNHAIKARSQHQLSSLSCVPTRTHARAVNERACVGAVHNSNARPDVPMPAGRVI